MGRIYDPEFKADLIAKLLPPQNVAVPALARESGVPKDTLYCWRLQARRQAREGATNRSATANDWPSKARFEAVLESAAMNAEQTAEYCRRRGLYPEQLAAWRRDCEQAGAASQQVRQGEAAEVKAQRTRIRELERELRRKDAALAETAALLALKKKAQAIWGDNEA
jgi:transposase-like protein